jgi:hypothetical protein
VNMSDKMITSVVSILAIVAVAVVAVLVSNQANTGSVFGALGSSISCALGTALSPVTGSSGNCQGTSVTSSISFPGL